MKKINRIPVFLRSVLCSYDLRKMSLEKDKETIITRILNYGDWNDLKWLYSAYTENDIKRVVTHPFRGSWFVKALNFWEKMLNLRLPDKIRKKALLDINPNF
jgi:hypothetical protein